MICTLLFFFKPIYELDAYPRHVDWDSVKKKKRKSLPQAVINVARKALPKLKTFQGSVLDPKHIIRELERQEEIVKEIHRQYYDQQMWAINEAKLNDGLDEIAKLAADKKRKQYDEDIALFLMMGML